MDQLLPEETVLRGYWLDLGSRMVPDSTWERITQLVTKQLEELAAGLAGPARLFRDPRDGRYWELTPVSPTLPQGPPLLAAIDADQARQRYPEAFSP